MKIPHSKNEEATERQTKLTSIGSCEGAAVMDFENDFNNDMENNPDE